jgi:IclR family pca regulon transcriptional regulator
VSDSSGQRRPPRSTSAAERDPSYNRHSVSVDRGFAILERFNGQRGSESIADIAASVDLPRSSVHRYIQTLAVLGLVEQRGTPRRRYRLTAGAGAPGIVAMACTGLGAAARDELVALRRGSACTARLAIRLGLDALLVEQAVSFAPGQGMLALQARPGTRLRDARCALRQALLADLDLDALPQELQRAGRTAHAALAEVRKRRAAIEDGAGKVGPSAVAVPITLAEDSEAIAAIDLIGNAPEVTPAMLEAHLDKLQAAAQRLAPIIAELPWTQWRPYKRRASSAEQAGQR